MEGFSPGFWFANVLLKMWLPELTSSPTLWPGALEVSGAGKREKCGRGEDALESGAGRDPLCSVVGIKYVPRPVSCFQMPTSLPLM